MNLRCMTARGAACCLLFLACCACGFAAGKRTALVVGNQRYEPAVGPLRNAANDAKAVARTLRGLGFTVIERTNLNRDQLLAAMDEFRRTLPGAEVGLFFYAGHGLSIDGANYLVPIKSGFSPDGADDVTLRMLAETRLFNAEQAVADMSSAGAQCTIVILDACRTVRLPNGGRTRDLSTKGGLSEMTPPAGSLIAFATDAGRVAFDGDGANGLYTEELLKHMTSPGLTIEQVFKRTREGVLRRSDGGQLPAEYSRLVGEDIYLAGEKPVRVALPVEPAQPVVEPAGDRSEEELLSDASTFAAAGDAENCIAVLERVAAGRGPGDYAAAPLAALLDGVKEDLKASTAPSPKVVKAAATCERVRDALPGLLPADHPDAKKLAASARNRRGDALLVLGRAEEALGEYEAAMKLDPDDAYILYNRGCANLALGRREEAMADFNAAAGPRFNQPGARKLATRALEQMK